MKLKLYTVAPFILQATLWHIVMRPFFSLFTRFEVHGLEHLRDLPSGVIFAPNHSSELDSVLLPLALPLWSRFSPMFYIVREPKFYTDPVFAWRRHFYSFLPFKALGAYAIVSGAKDYAVSLNKHVELLNDGASVCIFPEGSFSKNGVIGSAHGGVGYLAFAASKPVVPVFISGTLNISVWGLLTRNIRIQVTFTKSLVLDSTNKHVEVTDFKNFAERVLIQIRSVKEQSVSQSLSKNGPSNARGALSRT